MLDLIKKLDEFFVENKEIIENHFYTITITKETISLQGGFDESVHSFLLKNFDHKETWINETGTCCFYEFSGETDNFYINITLSKEI